MTWKPLFAVSIWEQPDRLHFAAHSHHLWPDASYDGQSQAWTDAAVLADRKWAHIMGPLWQDVQQSIAAELNLPDPSTIAFAPNTHDFFVRIVSAIPKRPVRILSTDGEFHSFRRQAERWVESGDVTLEMVAPDAVVERAGSGEFDLIFASHVLFNSGTVLRDLRALADLAHPEGPWVVIDGYHGFMAIETDLSSIADKVLYLAGGYKYAMAGEGVCFLHVPSGFAERPAITGWYAAFDDLSAPPDRVGYAPDARRMLGSTFDPSGLYRFQAVQRLLTEHDITTAKISTHVAALQEQFTTADPLPDFTLLNPLDGAPHARFLAYKGTGAAELHTALDERDVITDVRGDVLRIGFGAYHEADDVEKLLGILADIRST